MKHERLILIGRLACALAVAIPLAAQAPSDDILQGTSRPPHVRANLPATANSSPTGIFPQKMRAAYGFNLGHNTGAGQTIAIVDAFDDPNIEADFGVFNTTFHLPACTTANGCFKKIYASGTKPPSDTSGWSDEMAIDVQWAHAIAPSAKIILVEANSNSNADLYLAVDVAVANGASVVSMSWGGGESSSETSSDFHFSVPNVVMVTSSGDGGHGAQYPAASPYVVAVGGTSLTINNSTGAWVSETAWNESGGGASRYEAEPTYQSAVQTTGKRGIPDVAYDGDPNTGVPAYSTWACGACFTGWEQWGGTSIGAPQWAGLFAIANSLRAAQGKTNLDQAQFLLYANAEAAYHDITSGTNGSCGSQCTATAGYDFVTGVGSPQAQLVIKALALAP